MHTNKIPYGYIYQNYGKSRYKIIDLKAEIIKKIFTLFIEFQDITTVTKLIKDELPNATYQYIKFILTNSKYAGKPPFPPIIDTDTYNEVQAILSNSKKNEHINYKLPMYYNTSYVGKIIINKFRSHLTKDTSIYVYFRIKNKNISYLKLKKKIQVGIELIKNYSIDYEFFKARNAIDNCDYIVIDNNLYTLYLFENFTEILNLENYNLNYIKEHFMEKELTQSFYYKIDNTGTLSYMLYIKDKIQFIGSNFNKVTLKTFEALDENKKKEYIFNCFKIIDNTAKIVSSGSNDYIVCEKGINNKETIYLYIEKDMSLTKKKLKELEKVSDECSVDNYGIIKLSKHYDIESINLHDLVDYNFFKEEDKLNE